MSNEGPNLCDGLAHPAFCVLPACKCNAGFCAGATFLEHQLMSAQKGNGPGATNDRPAKTHTKYAIDFIAAYTRPASVTASFRLNPCAGMGKVAKDAAKGCDTVLFGASHTTKQAANLPDSEVFSRSEFEAGLTFQGSDGYGAGSAYPQGRQHNLFCVTKPSSTLCPSQADGGLSVQQGTKSMTTTTPTLGNTSPLTRQQAIETALSEALHLVRNIDSHHGIHAATGRACRAASMLKQACAEFQNGRSA